MVATIASFGYERVPVSIKPRVTILATGTEIVDVGVKPGKDQIRNSNSWSLGAFAKRVNANVKILEIASDDLESLSTTINTAILAVIVSLYRAVFRSEIMTLQNLHSRK